MVCIDARGNVTACQKPLSLQELFQLYYEAGFRGDALQQIVAHTMIESSGIPNKSFAGAGTATGLLQWEPETWAGYGGGALSNRLDPATQARVAFQAWQRNGFSDWTCAGCEPGWSSSGWAGWKQRVQQAFAAWSPGLVAAPAGSSASVYPSGWFSLTGVRSAFHISSYLSADGALLGHAAVDELNYILPAGSKQPVTLPPGGNYSFVRSTYSPRVGWQQVWQTPGGVMAFLHLSSIVPFTSGQVVPGGTTVGVSGWPLDPAYGNGTAGPTNAHLSVVLDQGARNFLDSLSGSGSGGGTGFSIPNPLSGIPNPFSGVPNPLDIPDAIGAAVTSVELGARHALFVVLGVWLAMLGLMLLVMSSPTAKKAATTVAKAGL